MVDQVEVNRIISTINGQANDIILEIGPGLGALTRQLVGSCCKLIAVEIDRDLVAHLQAAFAAEINNQQLIIINQDILRVDLSAVFAQHVIASRIADQANFKVVGNLPYNISTPLLFKLLQCGLRIPIQDLHFLLQQEVAERLIAVPGSKAYGRLSIMAQYHAAINIMFNLSPEAFDPVPRVYSSLVRLQPYLADQLPIVAANYQHFYTIVTTAFSQRRKIISNGLKAYCNHQDWQALNIDPQIRPELLTVADFVNISNYLVTAS